MRRRLSMKGLGALASSVAGAPIPVVAAPPQAPQAPITHHAAMSAAMRINPELRPFWGGGLYDLTFLDFKIRTLVAAGLKRGVASAVTTSSRADADFAHLSPSSRSSLPIIML